jgi:hypothetical protein
MHWIVLLNAPTGYFFESVVSSGRSLMNAARKKMTFKDSKTVIAMLMMVGMPLKKDDGNVTSRANTMRKVTFSLYAI